MSQETRNALLHGQLQDGLRYEVMEPSAVSGAQTYSELCLASRNEEKRLCIKSYHTQMLNTSSTPAAIRMHNAQSLRDPHKGNDSESRKWSSAGALQAKKPETRK